MNRPQYETSADLEQERRFIATISPLWHCELRKLPVAYGLDFAVLRGGNVVAWLEFKRRHRALHAHSTVYLSLQKVMAAQRLTSIAGDCYYVVQFDDVLAYVKIPTNRSIVFKGRIDRNDWQDQEPVVVINTDEFRIVRDEQRKAA